MAPMPDSAEAPAPSSNTGGSSPLMRRWRMSETRSSKLRFSIAVRLSLDQSLIEPLTTSGPGPHGLHSWSKKLCRASKLQSLQAMAKSPVRRAFFILFIAAAVVTALLLVAQDQVTLRIRSAAGAAEPRHTNYIAGLLGAPVAHGNKITVL